LAFNFSVFKTRALTALVFVAVMLTGLFWNIQAFLVLFCVIHFGCWYEFVKLLKKINPKKYLSYCFLGLIYISLPCLMMIDFRTMHLDDSSAKPLLAFGTTLPIGIFCSIWLNDTLAYLVGSFIGKTPLSKISPKKTVEGTAGGIILSTIMIGYLFPLLIDNYFDPFFKQYNWFIIAAICAVFGTIGDLIESKLKRMANVKDSGSFMPGHGGFLDRFDSMLVAVPFVWLYTMLF